MYLKIYGLSENIITNYIAAKNATTADLLLDKIN